MALTPEQIDQYDRDGFLIFPDLFSSEEVAVLRREVRQARHHVREIGVAAAASRHRAVDEDPQAVAHPRTSRAGPPSS